MSMTYEWEIVEVGVKDSVNNDNEVLNEAIVEVTWKKTGTDLSNNSAEYLGRTVLDPSATSAASFVAYDEVTSSTIIDWLESTITAEAMQKIDAVIEKSIADSTITKRAFNA